MLSSSYINASAATLYIIFVASVMFYGIEHTGRGNAVMGYLFLYQPIQLYLDGKKKNALHFFLQTVAIFAGITILVFALLLSGVFK